MTASGVNPDTAAPDMRDSARLTAIGVFAALSLHFSWLLPYVKDGTHEFDAIHLYQPLARGLLDSGLAFFGTEKSIEAPPFSYAYQAMLGASLPITVWVNFVLSGFTLLLVFRTAWLLHSRAAGLAAAFLFAASPLLKPFVAAPLTEGPFLLLGACWIWGLSEWLIRGRRGCVFAAGIAISLAVLTRATLFWWLVVLVAAFGWLGWAASGQARHRARVAFAAHLLALGLPVLFIAKNLILFGFPFFATGAGNALYLGNHPVTGGYDAYYYNLVNDEGSVARDQSQLSLNAEHVLGMVARKVVLEEGALAVASLHAKKLAAFLFVTDAERDVPELRSWRIALMIFTIVGLAGVTSIWMRWILGGLLLYQVAVHIPVLYTHRYSVGAIDLWLIIAGGVGVAFLLTRKRWTEIAGVAAVTIIGITIGNYLHNRGEMPEPNIFRGARMLVWEGPALVYRFNLHNLVIETDVRDAPRFHPWNNHVLLFDASLVPGSTGQECGVVGIAYKHEDGVYGRTITRRLEPDGEVHRHEWGVTNIRLNADGKLRLTVECAPGSVLAIRRIAIYAPLAGVDYARRFLGLPSPFPLDDR